MNKGYNNFVITLKEESPYLFFSKFELNGVMNVTDDPRDAMKFDDLFRLNRVIKNIEEKHSGHISYKILRTTYDII